MNISERTRGEGDSKNLMKSLSDAANKNEKKGGKIENTMNEVSVVGKLLDKFKNKKENEEGDIIKALDVSSDIINYSSVISSTLISMKYNKRLFSNNGYWRAANKNFYPLSLTLKGGKGWNFYLNSANKAANSIKWLGRTFNGLGYLSTAYSTVKFINNPNILDGTEIVVGVGSIFIWEVGAGYYGGKGIYTMQQDASQTLIENGHGDDSYMFDSSWMH